MSRARALILVPALLAASGCATILNENSRTVTVQSNLPGAQAVLDGRPIGPTPVTVQVTNSHDHTILVHAPGHAPQTCQLDASISAGWLVLDIILIPLLLPIIVDAVTGEWRDLEQTDCFVTLVHLSGAPPMAAPGPPPGPPPGDPPPGGM